ncbi:hypothetical protein B566_EDAN012736 [Ephemera danica]|nr:hypothetical protein B566_EDAN012736 [Ephemera danica]
MDTLRKEDEPPVVFALNRNLFVLVKIVTLSCCVHKTVWCFTTRGLRCEGQDEMVFILEALPEEKCVPRDVFAHISAVYVEAGKGKFSYLFLLQKVNSAAIQPSNSSNNVTDLGHTTFHGPFLGSNDHGGFLYIRPTSQCLQRLVLPPPPYLVAILLQRWEAPWARLFPLRLLLRLGYEFRYYPCPLVSVRERRPVYCEVGQTILDILAVLQFIWKTGRPVFSFQGIDTTRWCESSTTPTTMFWPWVDLSVEMPTVTWYAYKLTMRRIIPKPSAFSTVLVKAMTGASFLVFNGALKTSSGLSAKSSIVEDGLMVQVPPDMMQALRAALRDMKNFSVGCGPALVHPPAETVVVTWVDDDCYFNVG